TGVQTCALPIYSGGHSGPPVSTRHRLQERRERLGSASNTVQAHIQGGATEDRVIDVIQLPRIDAQLRSPDDWVYTSVHEGSDGDRPCYSDPVLQVTHQTHVTPGEDDRLRRDGNGERASARVARILRNDCAVWVSQTDDRLVRQKRHRRN